MNINTSFTVNPAQHDMLSVLPRDVVDAHIIPLLLTAKDMTTLGQVSRRYRQLIQQNPFYLNLIKGLGIQTIDPYVSAKDQVNMYHEIEKVSKPLFAFVARTIGPVAFSKLPVLDLKGVVRDYIDFVRAEEMTAPVMKGVDDAGRPFLALRYINDQKVPLLTKVIVVFHRYRGSDLLVNGTYYYGACFDDRNMPKAYMEYMGRLLKHEPCGKLEFIACDHMDIDPVRTLPDGRSIVELV